MSNTKKVAPGGKIAQAAQTSAKYAGKAAEAARDGAKIAAEATADFAKKTGKYLDAKSRAYLDAEFAKHRPAGIANVSRLRKEHPRATPAEVIDQLSAEFMQTEKGVSPKSDKFLAASIVYVVSLNEIYGDRVRDNTQRQILLYVLLAANSNVARVAAQVGVLALSFVSKRFGAVSASIAAAVAWVKKNSGRLSWVTALAKLAQIEHAGRKSASWIVVNASLKILGPTPTDWPISEKAALTKSLAKIPVVKISRASS
jgi:hypothetical protein